MGPSYVQKHHLKIIRNLTNVISKISINIRDLFAIFMTKGWVYGGVYGYMGCIWAYGVYMGIWGCIWVYGVYMGIWGVYGYMGVYMGIRGVWAGCILILGIYLLYCMTKGCMGWVYIYIRDLFAILHDEGV